MSRCRGSGQPLPGQVCVHGPAPRVRRNQRCAGHAGGTRPVAPREPGHGRREGQDGTRQGLISSRSCGFAAGHPPGAPAHACRARPYQSRRGSGACGTKTGHSPQEEAQVFLSMNGSGVPGEEERTLTKGRSASIPLEERFQNEENDKDELTPGRSTQISYEERKKGSRMQ